MDELDPQWKQGRDECFHLVALYFYEMQCQATDEWNKIKQKRPINMTLKYYELEAKCAVLKQLIDNMRDMQPGKIENNQYIPNIKGFLK